MKTRFSSRFARDLRKIKDEVLLERVNAVIEDIEAAETVAGIANLKKLKGYSHLYRIRIGDYRLGVYCESDDVQLMRFGPRKDFYRKLP
jgi:mRNA interferase RelE/StbE